ncbi:hypothetical protein SAMN06269117_11328 [Balnearium lithotrophicum]|uniref:Uncharacterized protein n=1 Tax=Balnearium lithotrophicum TaxID=223788 RepID=A0A521CJE6_9BACT|nr:hypothetical protein [Balnearium lithotrophicum]SMO59544.1 hypothetical protein SAMN06269117_11328 [Balnearium lithotrophicum]
MEVLFGFLFFVFIAVVSIGTFLSIAEGILYLLLSIPRKLKERKIRKLNRKLLKKRLSYLT